MMPPSWKSEIEEAIEKSAHASGERQKAESEKNAAEIAGAINRFVDAYNAQGDKPERKDKIKRFLDVATVFLLFGTAVFTGLAWWVFKGQLGALKSTDEAIHRQLTLMENDQRPSLHLGEAQLIRGSGPHDPNPEVSFKLINTGKSATVLRAININCELLDSVPTVPTYKATTKIGRNVFASGAILSSNIFGPCKMKPISEADWVAVDAGDKVIFFYGTLKYDGQLSVVYTKHFGLVLIRDEPHGGFGEPGINSDAHNYEETERPKG